MTLFELAKRKSRTLSRAWLLPLLLLASPLAADGKLFIVGGALNDRNNTVYRAFINALPVEGPVVIIPVASGQPMRASQRFAANLVHYGMAEGRVQTFPLAVRDDSASEEVDESLWSQTAWDEDRVAKVADAAGFWFTGGDQTRITQTLLNEEGQESPLLQLIRDRLEHGATIGGTSAGAAIMSREMIAGGDSFRALLQPLASGYSSTEEQDSGRLFMSKGLGFLPTGIVDQHFDRKARLGRLVRALEVTGQSRGFGVDEDTALLIDLESGRSSVLGRGSVTLIDASKAEFDFQAPTLAKGMELSVIASGVSFRLSDFEVLSGQGDATRGKEYYGYEPLNGGGMAFANHRLDQALGYDLLDNDATERLDRLSIDAEGRIVVYSFIETEATRGFWRREGSGECYTISRVRFDISRR